MNDAAGNSAQAGDDPQALRRRTGWVASLLHRLAGAFPRRDAGPSPARPGVGRDVDLIIERRALMLHNRSRKSASAYRRVHAILSRGRA